ncbi:MAG: heme-binding domain-containing protein [Saprospiraceae bacterium]|nr:heme-binding domain-containing protein [Saprospiraceae bacterium]
MKKYVKPFLWALLALLLLSQFIRPARNQSNDQTHHISTKFTVPDTVESILKVACYDCHSNYTRYPWYANVQPVAWWLADHVDEGKRELNFSAFTTRKIAVQNHKLEEIIEMIREGEMPLSSFTWVHRDAILSQGQKDLLINWAQSGMDSLKAHYPADSLVLRRGTPPPK